jgi:hypothetical protein
MSGKDEHAPLRALAAAPVHARALWLDFAEWSAVLLLPFLCESNGQECPGWALALCQHAAAVCLASPPALLQALEVADRDRAGVCCEPGIAAVGVSLDLCVAVPNVGRGAWVVITAFGHAVARACRLPRATLVAWAKHRDG